MNLRTWCTCRMLVRKERAMHFSLVAGLTFRQGQRTLELVRELDKSEYLIEDVITRSEEHTSELQSPCNLVCRLLLEKKNNIVIDNGTHLHVRSQLPHVHYSVMHRADFVLDAHVVTRLFFIYCSLSECFLFRLQGGLG